MSLLVATEDAPPPPPSSAALVVPVETTDAQLVELWLHGKARHTQRAYRTEAERFLHFVACPLRAITLMDLQAYADSLDGAPATRIRALSAVKSLLSFGQRTGFLQLNVGAALKLPVRKDTLAERILDEADVVRIWHSTRTVGTRSYSDCLHRRPPCVGDRRAHLARPAAAD